MLKSRSQLEAEWMGKSFAQQDADATNRVVREYRQKLKAPSLDVAFIIRTVLPVYLVVYGLVAVVDMVLV